MGDPDAAERALAAAEARGDPAAVALVRLVLSSRARDRRALSTLIDSSGTLLRQDPDSAWLLANARYRIQGLAAARDDMAEVAASSKTPAERRQEALALVEIADAMEGRGVYRLELGPDPVAPFMADRELPIVQAAINDLPPEYFIVDTGAPTSLLALDYCRRSGLAPLATEHAARDGAGRSIPLWWIVVDRLTIGTAVVHDVPMKVAPFPPELRLAGLLSPLDSCCAAVTELDWRRRVMRLIPRGEAAAAARDATHHADVIWEGGHPLVRGVVDGASAGWFLFDSGAGANLLTERFARAGGWDGSPGEIVLGTTLSAPSPVHRGHTGTLAVGDAPSIRTSFMVKAWEPDPREVIPVQRAGYVGTPWMRGRRIFLDPAGARVRFTLPA